MGPKIASNCPPMTLREREVLNATQLRFMIPSIPILFPATAIQVLTKSLLKTFINKLLSRLHHDKSLTEIPDPNRWGLVGREDGFVNLDMWDARRGDQDVYQIVALPVMSNLVTPIPIDIQSTPLGASGTQSSAIMSIELPSQKIFEIRGSHLLLVIEYRVRVKSLTQKKTKIDKKQSSVLIPADMKVVDLVKVLMPSGSVGGAICALFQVPDLTTNIRTLEKTATELGWKHGTELRLDIL